MKVVSALVKSDDCCWDIGGHYGYYTLSMAKLAPHGRVHTFEPVPSHADRIRQAATRSEVGNVTVHQVAVAGEVGTMSLRFSPEGDGDDSMAYLDQYGGVDTPAAAEHYSKFVSVDVATVTMDSALGDVDTPDFIKIDAEGAEVAIVSAATNLLNNARPTMLIELHGIYESLGCADVLRKHGYLAVLLADRKATLPVLWIPREDQATIKLASAVIGHDPIVLFGEE